MRLFRSARSSHSPFFILVPLCFSSQDDKYERWFEVAEDANSPVAP